MPHYSRKKREAMMAAARDHLSDGLSLHAACKALGCAQSAMTKWLNPAAKKAPVKIGRKRKLELTGGEANHIKGLMLKFESLPYAVEEFIAWEGASEVARRTLGGILNKARNEGKRPTWPTALTEISKIPEVIKALHRGRKHARKYEPKARRNGELIMEDGTVVKWAAGWVFESDDMSLNETYRFHDPALGRETTGRQGLFTLDAAANFNLQADLCGRPHDAYRVEDIADHFLNVVTTHGLPVVWRLEMGSWASNFVDGLAIKGRLERWGALNDLFYVCHKHESTGKANIERSFHEQQKRTAHASTSIGRERGEFEQATKLRRMADKGNEEALRYFWTMTDAADFVAEAARQENRRPRRFPKLDNIHTTPEELFRNRIQRRELNPEDAWYFCPVKREATIRGGVIRVKVDHYERAFRFITYGNQDFPIFAEKHPVLVAFHPAHPERGCHVFNACEGNAAKGFAWGEKIGVAEQFRDTPEEALNGEGDFGQLSKAKAHLRAEYRSIVPAGTGPGTLKSIARDGLGHALEIQRGGTPPQTGGSSADVVRPSPRQRQILPPATSSRGVRAGSSRAEEIARLKAQYEAAGA